MRVKFPKHTVKAKDSIITTYGTGEVAGVIQTHDNESICLIIADDESRRFIVEKACNCFKID